MKNKIIEGGEIHGNKSKKKPKEVTYRNRKKQK
jgi:hypothetical protein